MPHAPLEPPDCYALDAAEGWLELGLSVEARRELESLAAHEEHPDVLEMWWKVASAEGHWEEAARWARALVRCQPERSAGWITLAYALHELGRTQEAYEQLVQVVDKFSERRHYTIPYNLACYQCQLGHAEEALRWLRRAVEMCDSRTIQAMAAEDRDLEPLREEIRRL